MLRVFLTGRITVTSGDRSLGETSMPGTLGRVAFAALALERQRIASDVLADRLWPAGPPADWPKSLPPLVSKLRTSLRTLAAPSPDDGHGDGGRAPTIEARDGGYELVLPPSVWIDVEDGTRRLDRAEAALRHGDLGSAWLDAAPASAIFRRSFLTGFDAPWADAVRAQFVDRRYRTWLVLAEVWRRQGEFALARGATNEAIEADRWREDAHRLLIRIELDSGNRASARRAAQRCADLLRDELGVEPSEKTRLLIEETGDA